VLDTRSISPEKIAVDFLHEVSQKVQLPSKHEYLRSSQTFPEFTSKVIFILEPNFSVITFAL
jgi:hypothetical protein